MTRILLALLAFYQRWISPAIHTAGVGGCRFQPTCSEYAVRAIAMHGPLRGSGLAVWRLLRCHPFSRGGLDQVPPVGPSRLRGVPNPDARPIQNGDLQNSSVDPERSSSTLHPSVPEKPLP